MCIPCKDTSKTRDLINVESKEGTPRSHGAVETPRVASEEGRERTKPSKE